MSRGASIAVILNSRAGSVSARPRVVAAIGEAFRAAGDDVEILAPPAAEIAAAARHAAGRASIVVAAGGDGTVSSVAGAILESPAPLGVLPLGTRNHFAKDLGIPTELRDAVAIVAARHIGHVDVGRVNDRLFINNASIGLYPGLVRTREQLRRQGHRPWSASAIAVWRVISDAGHLTVAIEANGKVRRHRTPFVVVGNNAYVIDGLDFGGRSRLDEGQLFVYVTRRTRFGELLMLLAKGLIRRAARAGEFEIMAAAELTVSTTTTPVQIAIDGEIAVMHEPLRFRAQPGALRVVRPRG